MVEDRALVLERYSQPYGRRELSPANEETLADAIRALASEHSTTLTIEAGDQSLLVGASDGAFVVTAASDAGDFYDLVGDPAATGTMPFVLGGQKTPYPRRYLVNAEQALAAALEFFRTGTVNVTGGVWDRQGSGDAWERELSIR